MKTSVKILMLFWVIIFSVSSGFGQNFSQKSEGSKYIAVKNYKNMLPAGFMAGLHWQQFVNVSHRDKAANDFTYRIDTAVVYSNYINPQRYIYAYDSSNNKIVTYIELTTNENWNYVSMDTTTFDSVGNKLISVSKVWTNGKWVNASKEINTYAINHNVLSSVEKVWANSQWVYSDSSHFTYDVNGNKVASYRAVWSDTNSSWINNSFNIFSYDSVSNLKLSLAEKWKDTLWVNIQMVKYTYDFASNLILGLVQNQGDTGWVNFYKESYTYGSARNRLSYTGQIWNGSFWVNDQHYDYTYNNYGQLEAGIGENWKDNHWVYFEKGQFTYNTYGGVETYLYQKWKNEPVWRNVSLSQYNYDSVGNAYRGIHYAWDTLQHIWLQSQDGLLQIYYNYGSVVQYFTGYEVDLIYNKPSSTGVKNTLQKVISEYRCAPNPAFDHTTIRLGLNAGETVSLNLYELTGKKISTVYNGMLTKGLHRFEVPVSQLPSGIYLASLLTGKYVKTIKLVVRK